MQKKSTKINVVVFDFDGTLSSGDCNFDFGKYCFANSIRPWLFLPLVIVGLLARYLNPRGIWWREMSRGYLRSDLVRRLAPGFIKQHLRQRFGWSAERVANEKAAGNIVLLISAGPDYLIPNLVRDMKFDAIITTKTEQDRPWKFKFFCYAKNKVVALDKWAADNKVDINLVRSYGDSRADRFIMARANEQVWINPKTGARV